MSKVTLDMGTFKALASDTRLDILKALDGKRMNLKELSKVTNLNKATLHEHLTKLNEAGLVKKKERDGHKWVYYKLTWKGEGLLHPENTRIVVLFATTFIALAGGVIQLLSYLQSKVASSPSFSHLNLEHYPLDEADGGSEINMINISKAPFFTENNMTSSRDVSVAVNQSGVSDNLTYFSNEGGSVLYQDQTLLYIAIACFVVFTVVLCVSIWRYKKNKTPKL